MFVFVVCAQQWNRVEFWRNISPTILLFFCFCNWLCDSVFVCWGSSRMLEICVRNLFQVRVEMVSTRIFDTLTSRPCSPRDCEKERAGRIAYIQGLPESVTTGGTVQTLRSPRIHSQSVGTFASFGFVEIPCSIFVVWCCTESSITASDGSLSLFRPCLSSKLVTSYSGLISPRWWYWWCSVFFSGFACFIFISVFEIFEIFDFGNCQAQALWFGACGNRTERRERENVDVVAAVVIFDYVSVVFVAC